MDNNYPLDMKIIKKFKASNSTGCPKKKATINLFDFGPFLVFWTRSKVVQKGLKGTKIVNPSVWPFGTLLGPSGPLWTIPNKN